MNGAKARKASAATQTSPAFQTTTPGSGAVRRDSGSRRSAVSPCKEANFKACTGTPSHRRPAIHCTLLWHSTQGPSKNTTADVMSTFMSPKMRRVYLCNVEGALNWLKALGVAGFLFFLGKGILWLVVFWLVSKGVIPKDRMDALKAKFSRKSRT